MTDFESELKIALARQAPPSSFSARVLAAVDHRQHERKRQNIWLWTSWPWTWRLAPVAAVFLALSAVVMYWQHERIERGQAAKQKLLLAMQIAGSELEHTRQLVFHVEGPEAKQ